MEANVQIREKLERLREAQKKFASYSQTETDEIFRKAAIAANKMRISLAEMAAEETGMGVVEDKVIKNHFAAEYIYNAYKDTKTCGVLSRDTAYGTIQIAEPIGAVAAVIPTTNPTSTAIFKILLCLKTRNAIILSPHPRAKKCTMEAARIMREAAEAAGAPEGIIDWIEEPSLELTNELMKQADLILATGGPGMVKAAYSSGKPALGVGAGNVPAVIDESADIKLAVSSIVHSKTFDNGLICASEQAVLAPEKIFSAVCDEFRLRGCRILTDEETAAVRNILMKDGILNGAIVGQSAVKIAELAGLSVPHDTKVLIGTVTDATPAEPFAHEKLSPVLALYKTTDFDDALCKAERLIEDGGYGHTASIFIDTRKQQERYAQFCARMKACRIVVNTPSSHGGVGDLYNFNLTPSLTLGCGTWGGNSVSENVGVKHLLNIKTVAERRENMLWLKMPDKLYFKGGCLPVALRELESEYDAKRVMIVTDSFLFKSGAVKCITDRLSEAGLAYQIYSDVEPDPTLSSAKQGAKVLQSFEPDVIIAFGGGSAMDAAKIMWVLYEHPEADFMDMAMRFADIRKRIYSFPKMGTKARFIAVPTSSGTGSEVTPFAVITDEETGIKYPLADYSLMPNMAVVDTDLMLSQPKGLTAASGIDALTHALEAYASVMASDYTDGLALQAIKNIFEYLPRCYDDGSDYEAREKMANAATMAGIAFANAFLGICHSMAHKLGAFHHLPHGISNALLITEVMRFNVSPAPKKMATFSQYAYPKAMERYCECARYVGVKGSTEEELFEGLIKKIDELRKRIEIRENVRMYGVKEQDFMESLDAMTKQAFDDQCTGANPRYPLMSEIREIYLRVL
ncbi:MAG: bifunctional acetaldehyde-CoA/alcohol dehydrogenase [Oscillospiraceae bacterium]|nr:bifunctional acetaldehyde-CoA/alcohol dehydrogenase [Oscillospiraceae bacterium]